MKRLLLIITLLFIASVQYSAGFYFRHLLPEDGLANPAVISICQDSLGRMWFGTENGVSIYDGSSFTTLTPKQGQFIGSVIYTIICSSNGDVFLRTNNEVIKYDTKTSAIRIVYKTANALFIKNGEIYIIDGDSLYKWNDSKNTMEYIDIVPIPGVTKCIQDKSGRTWLLGREGLYYSSTPSDYIKVLSNFNIYTLFESSDGCVWVGSRQKGLYKITPDLNIHEYSTTTAGKLGFGCDDVRSVIEDKNGNIWFGTFNGLYRFNKVSGLFESFKREEKDGTLSNSSVYSLLIDKSGILWIGTYYGGVNYADIRRNTFSFYSTSNQNNGLSHPVVSNIKEDKNGNIWICTEGGGLNMLNPKNGKINQFLSDNPPYYLPYPNLKCMDYDPEKDLIYIGTASMGLFSYDIQKKVINAITGQDDNSRSMSFINSIVRKNDSLFLSTRGGVYLYMQDTGKDSLIFASRRYLSQPMANYQNTELWLGGEDIYVYDINTLKQIRSYKLYDKGEHVRPHNIYIARNGEIFVTTYKYGIFRLDREENLFKVFISSESSLMNQYCYNIVEDPASNIIVSGEKGINIIGRDGRLLQTFLISQHFPLTAIVRACGLAVTEDSTIYAGGTNGLLAFNENNIDLENTLENIYFSELYINGVKVKPEDGTGILKKSLPFTEEIKISHNIDRISLKFASRRNVAFFNVTDYEYRLSGHDDKWYQMDNDIITYNKLGPGHYTLEIRNRYKANNNNTLCSIGILKSPAWYASWWAILIYILFTAASLLLIIREIRTKAAAREEIRRQKQEKENLLQINEAKLRFFTSVSHELKTPLTIMYGQINMILQNYKLSPSVYNRFLKVLHQTKQLGGLISDLIEFRKYEQDKVVLHICKRNLNDLTAEIYDRFSDLAEQLELNFKLELSTGDTTVWIDPEQLERVIMNLISNAFKFTQKGKDVKLKTTVDDSTVSIHVIDQGRGISKDNISRIFDRYYRVEDGHIQGSGIGLSLAKDMIEMHHGSISVESVKGEGSDFCINLKRGYQHFSKDNKAIIETYEDPIVTQNETNAYISKQEMPYATKTEKETVAKAKILIVEDNPEILETIKEIFSPIYNVFTAHNGKEGLEAVKTLSPDLVLSDVVMPVMSGTELCSAIKNDITLCHIPVVLLTALDMPEQQINGLIQGADDYIGKPFDPKLLLARCNNIIRNRNMLLKKFGRDSGNDISLLATNRLDKEFLDKLSGIIEEGISDENLNNDAIAERMNMSRSSFYNKFKDLTGETPNEYLSNLRLVKASSMLIMEQGMSIAEISEALGFNSLSYFSRKFKDRFGLSPAQYRQENT